MKSLTRPIAICQVRKTCLIVISEIVEPFWLKITMHEQKHLFIFIFKFLNEEYTHKTLK